MELVTTQFTENDEIMTKISLIDCGVEIDHYVIYVDGKTEFKAKEDMLRTATSIQHFIERIYNYGKKGQTLEFYSSNVPIMEDEE